MSFVKGRIITAAIFMIIVCFPISSPAANVVNPCFSTLASDLTIHIPMVIYQDSSFDLTLAYREVGPGPGQEMWFEVTHIENSSVDGCTNPSTLFSDASGTFLIRLPMLVADLGTLWAVFEYCPTNDGKIWLKLRDYGLMPHLVFVTSESGTGDLSSWSSAGGKSGLAAADAVCQASAETAGLPGTFVALLSDENTDFYCHLHGFSGKKDGNCGQPELPAAAGPWVRTDGFPFAPSADQLFEKYVVYAPVLCHESGSRVPAWTYYWSRTSGNGQLHWVGGETCSNWTVSTSQERGGVGSPLGATSSWASYGDGRCSADHQLLCIQTGVGPALPDITTPGKVVFLTSVTGTGNLGAWPDAGGKTGIEAGDAICRARAAAVGLDNAQNFKAWLSTSEIDAKDRLVSDGPWKRVDGVIVARNKADLTDGELFTNICQFETGKYWGGTGMWTGTSNSGVKLSDTCHDWSEGGDAGKGITGNTGSVIKWSDKDYSTRYGYIAPCTRPYRLLCFED